MIEIRTNIGKAKGADGIFREFDGLRGRKGDAGPGVTAIEAEYYSSTSDRAPTGGSWSAEIPSYDPERYIWMRVHVFYSDSNDGYTTPRLYNFMNDISEYEAIISASETSREAHEAARIASENQRAINEANRVEAERLRAAAETERSQKWNTVDASASSVGPNDSANVSVIQARNSITFDFEIPRGQKGDIGEAGVSPTITVESISHGHRVIITDATGVHSFDVMDGDGGITSVDWDIIENKPDAYPPTIATTSSLGGIIVGNDLLVTEEGRLSVDKTDSFSADNTKPVTAAAVYTEIGNINALLATI